MPGDVVRLGAGDLVPANARLLTAKDLHVQQSALTGESMPVEKKLREDDSSDALAVGLTREFLPMITTVTLARGAVAMAKHKVIVSTSRPSKTSAALMFCAATKPER